MAIPDFQTIMLPILRLLGDGRVHRLVPELTEAVSHEFQLTDADRQQTLLSGRQATFVNRTHWAVSYLSKAALLERPSRGAVKISDRGQAVLKAPPPRIDIRFLMQYPEFVEFRTRVREPAGRGSSPPALDEDNQNPEELLYRTYDALRQSVEAEIFDRLQTESFSWQAFEDLVVELLGAMGYGSSTEETSRRVTKRSGDDGIDGVIDEDKLGLDAVYIQAKKYGAKVPVGRPALQAFAGSLEGQRASKGVFITTSHFTSDAEDYVRRISRRIVLVDGRMLARLMYDHGVGVRPSRTLTIKRVDDAYFEGDV